MIQNTHPSGRPRTALDATTRAALVVGPGPLNRAVSQDCWLLAKELQRLRDGRAASLSGAQCDRLERLPSHWPRPHLRAVPSRISAAPAVIGHDTSDIDAARQGALPATRAAIARLWARTGGGDDAA